MVESLQNELTGISVFAFIALEWNSKKPNSDGNHEAKNDYAPESNHPERKALPLSSTL